MGGINHMIYQMGYVKGIFHPIEYFLSKGYLAVDVFFILSSIVMSITYNEKFNKSTSSSDYFLYMKKRFIRIYPAYFFWLISFEFFVRNFEILAIFSNLFLLQNLFNNEFHTISIVLWSLSSEWIIYFIFPFMLFCLSKIKDIFILTIILIFSFSFLYFLPSWDNYYLTMSGVESYNDNYNHGLDIVKGISSILRCFFPYMIGISGFLILKFYLINKTIELNSFYFISVVLLLLCFFSGIDVFILFGFFIFVLYLLVAGERKNLFNTKIFLFLGKISYSIYLVHMFLLISLSILAAHFFDNDFYLFIVIFSLLLVIPISYLSYVFVEKKGSNFLRNLILKK